MDDKSLPPHPKLSEETLRFSHSLIADDLKKCPTCRAEFNDIAEALKHEETIHDGIEAKRCTFCWNYFAHTIALQHHVKFFHTK